MTPGSNPRDMAHDALFRAPAEMPGHSQHSAAASSCKSTVSARSHHHGGARGGWLLSSVVVAYALTRRHGPRTVEPVPQIGDWKLEVTA